MIQEITQPDTTTPTTTDRPVYRITIPEVFGYAERELVIPAPHTAAEIATVVHAELTEVGYDGSTIDVQVELSTGTVRITWDGAPLHSTLTGPGVGAAVIVASSLRAERDAFRDSALRYATVVANLTSLTASVRATCEAYADEPPPIFRGPNLSEQGLGYNRGTRDMARAVLSILAGEQAEGTEGGVSR